MERKGLNRIFEAFVISLFSLASGAYAQNMRRGTPIHDAAADLLKDKPISPKAIRMLNQVSCVRQLEIAELMVSENNFTSGYAPRPSSALH